MWPLIYNMYWRPTGSWNISTFLFQIWLPIPISIENFWIKEKFPVFRHLAQIWVSQVIYFNFIDFPVKQCAKIFKIHKKWNFLFVWQRLNSPSSHTGTYTELSGTKAWVALQLYTSYMLVIFICFSKKNLFK